jgi:hypothetical protein
MIVPQKYSGQWIAWNRRQTKIVASGRGFSEVRKAALKAGEKDPILEKVPPSNVLGHFRQN